MLTVFFFFFLPLLLLLLKNLSKYVRSTLLIPPVLWQPRSLTVVPTCVTYISSILSRPWGMHWIMRTNKGGGKRRRRRGGTVWLFPAHLCCCASLRDDLMRDGGGGGGGVRRPRAYLVGASSEEWVLWEITQEEWEKKKNFSLRYFAVKWPGETFHAYYFLRLGCGDVVKLKVESFSPGKFSVGVCREECRDMPPRHLLSEPSAAAPVTAVCFYFSSYFWTFASPPLGFCFLSFGRHVSGDR